MRLKLAPIMTHFQIGASKMNEKVISLQLTVESVNAILAVLGDLPTKSGAYPLVVDIKKQTENQIDKINEQ